MPPDQSPAAGQLLAGRYRLDRQIARGGMAQVWKGTDLVLGRTVAVKLLQGRFVGAPTFVERFRREAQAAARLNDPHIVAIFDSITEGDISALILEYVRGLTLRQWMDDARRDHETLDLHVAVRIAAQVAEALQAAHVAGVVHRDIKPGNILLADGEPADTIGPPVPDVRVTDFGIAKAITAVGPDLTTAGTMLGTAKYLAPEQVEGGPVDARTDVFSLGVVLYEMLTGVVPWQADSDLATATARLHDDPMPPHRFRSDVPAELATVVLCALARDPGDRFATAADFRAALLTADPGPSVARRSLPRVVAETANEATVVRPARPRRLLPVVGVVLVVALLAITLGRSRTNHDLMDIVPGSTTGRSAASAATLDANSTVAIAGLSATTFDPFGDDEENDRLTGFITDGESNSTKVWHTECYPGDFADLPKAGVGFVLDTGRTITFSGLELDTRQAGWRADIYVSNQPSTMQARDLIPWHTPVATIQATGPLVHTTFAPVEGRSLLVFFTSLAGVPADDCFGERRNSYRVDVAEARVFGTV